MLAEQGLLNDMVNQITQSKKKVIQAPIVSSNTNKTKKRPIVEKKKAAVSVSKNKKRR